MSVRLTALLFPALHLSVLAALCVPRPATSASPVPQSAPRFQTLASDERLVIRLTSRSCFHWLDSEIAYATAGTALAVAEASGSERAPCGTVTLQPGDLARLDATLAFWRSKPAHRCTNVMTGSITLVRAGKVVSEETFVDGSCELPATGYDLATAAFDVCRQGSSRG